MSCDLISFFSVLRSRSKAVQKSVTLFLLDFSKRYFNLRPFPSYIACSVVCASACLYICMLSTRVSCGEMAEPEPHLTEKDSAGFVDSKENKNEWVLNKAGVKRELLDTVKARKLAYYGHTTRKQGSCSEKEIMQGTMPGARRRERPRTAWMDNTKTWTGLSAEEPIRMTEDRDKWRKYVHGVANPRIEDG